MADHYDGTSEPLSSTEKKVLRDDAAAYDALAARLAEAERWMSECLAWVPTRGIGGQLRDDIRRWAMNGETTYSKKFKGDKGNYGWPVSFDVTDGYVGINQHADDGMGRVLLTPSQMNELLRFLGATSTVKATP